MAPPDRPLRLRSVQSSERDEIELDDVGPGNRLGWAATPQVCCEALQDPGHQVGGFDVMADGRVPLGAGLSSSAALECAVATAVFRPP